MALAVATATYISQLKRRSKVTTFFSYNQVCTFKIFYYLYIDNLEQVKGGFKIIKGLILCGSPQYLN